MVVEEERARRLLVLVGTFDTSSNCGDRYRSTVVMRRCQCEEKGELAS